MCFMSTPCIYRHLAREAAQALPLLNIECEPKEVSLSRPLWRERGRHEDIHLSAMQESYPSCCLALRRLGCR